MKSYDYIFTGGGCAALSLAWQMLQQPALKEKRILILDKDTKSGNDRTWCFWETGEGPFESILEKKWERAWFHGPGLSKLLDLKPYAYKMIRADRFYSHTLDFLRSFPGVEIVHSEVGECREEKNMVRVTAGDQQFEAPFVFNSIVPKRPKQPGHFYLLQHFKGWVIQTSKPVFSETEATLMDFRVEQEGECRFMYILPTSSTTALVEFTVFSENLLESESYDSVLKEYLEERIGLTGYEIIHKEAGAIPMFSEPFEKAKSNRIINIGTAGGQTKASTGYTFTRIQRHSARIVETLVKTGQPVLPGSRSEKRFAYYDKVLLHVLANKKVPAAKIFQNLFRHNKAAAVFRFLDEDTDFFQEYKIMNSVPVLKFIGPGWKELVGW
ncbi:MAG TPA: lycopene cyclase family protein [Catalimonadaceae bacterium]|nr:lycopene cyclase family protein [Catalimonadaceae bacterium]